MKKIVVLYAVIFYSFLQAMDHAAPELKVAWSCPLKQYMVSLNLQEYKLLGYDSVKCDDTGEYLAIDAPIEWQGSKYTGSFSVGKKIIKDESCLRILDQECKKSENGCTSSWELRDKKYDTYMAIPLDLWGNEYSYCDFKSLRFVYDFEQCLAVALINRWQRESGKLDQIWCLCCTHIYKSFKKLAYNNVEVRLLKKFPKFDSEVLEVCILPGGKKIVFFLADGTIVWVSPDEVQAPRIKGTRCENLSDLFFRFV